MELINVSHIFHDPSVKACLPIDMKFDDAILYTRLQIQSGPKHLILLNLLVI